MNVKVVLNLFLTMILKMSSRGSHYEVLIDTNNRNELFSVKLLSAEIQDALSNLESGLDDWDRRRVALFHGMVQFPSLLDPSLKSS